MNGRDLVSINSSLPALVKRQRDRGDRRPVAVLVDEILGASGFVDIDARQQIAGLKRRAATARRAATRTAGTGKACFT